jgi:hypothetical protein
MVKAPNSRRNLDEAIRRASGIENFVVARDAMANAIVAQMLPNGVVKGGSALKLRFGDNETRYTTDLDTARATDVDTYIDSLEEALGAGWNGFTGHVVQRPPAEPKDVPPQYVMQPFDVKLSYNGKPWTTVQLEIGHNELGDADEPDFGIASDIGLLFEKVGLPVPKQIPLMPLYFQIAQKLHGLSEAGSKRAHDLIDLQVITRLGDVDYLKTKQTCIRLFEYRNLQAWPPAIEENDGWDTLYADQIESLDVLPTVTKAVAWANGLISKIDSAE